MSSPSEFKAICHFKRSHDHKDVFVFTKHSATRADIIKLVHQQLAREEIARILKIDLYQLS